MSVNHSTLPLDADEAGEPSAPLVALVHGTMDRAAGMLKLSRRLDRSYRVLRYDRRGYGRSTPHPGPFDIEHQVADLVSLLDGRSAVLVGHSFGGNVALAAADRFPHLVQGVVVYETPLSWEPWWPGTTAGGAAVASATDPAAAAEGFMRRLIGDERWEGLPERTRATRRAEGPAMVGELADIRARPPWSASRIGVPVAVGYGERARPHHRDGMSRLAGMLPDATLVMLPGCAHSAPTTHPDLFCELLVSPLLERVCSR
ncbi:MAG: hypothetical protein RLZ14_1526 [Actinomycetota bacterium]